jgi:hypothetical protein
VLRVKNDSFVKSRKAAFCVIPAKAGIQYIEIVTKHLDSGFHRSDDFLRGYQKYIPEKLIKIILAFVIFVVSGKYILRVILG